MDDDHGGACLVDGTWNILSFGAASAFRWSGEADVVLK
jgi:hypothetical protein